MNTWCRALPLTLLFALALGIAGCGARAGLDDDRPQPQGPPVEDAGPPPLDATPPADASDARPADAADASDASDASDAADSSLLPCAAYPAPARAFPLTTCGDLGPRIQDPVPTHIDRQLPCDVQVDAFSCGATALSFADCEGYCLSDSFDLLSLNGQLTLTCSVWIYAHGAHEVQCDTASSQ